MQYNIFYGYFFRNKKKTQRVCLCKALECTEKRILLERSVFVCVSNNSRMNCMFFTDWTLQYYFYFLYCTLIKVRISLHRARQVNTFIK